MTATVPVADWAVETLSTVAAHICATYHITTRDELELLALLAKNALAEHGDGHPELAKVLVLVHELTNDMLPHMLKEEQVLFPYVTQLELANADGTPAPVPFFGTEKKPVRMMMLEHDRVEALLAELRAVTNAYALPGGVCFNLRELYRRLKAFEELTHEHIHIENDVYFPRAVLLEEEIGHAPQFGGDCHGGSWCGH
jgi:regulator of cell morphogenesis and NO signaling